MKIPLINDHLLYEYFFTLVYRSGYKRHKCLKVEKYISRLLFKIEVWFHFFWRFIWSMSINSVIHKRHKCTNEMKGFMTNFFVVDLLFLQLSFSLYLSYILLIISKRLHYLWIFSSWLYSKEQVVYYMIYYLEKGQFLFCKVIPSSNPCRWVAETYLIKTL